MALATILDVEDALGRELDESESGRVESLLDRSSDLVIGYLHPCVVPSPTPGAVTRVVAEMATSALLRPAATTGEAQSLNSGPFGVTYVQGTTGSGPYLTAALKSRLAPFRCGSGMVSVQLGSERY